MAISVKRYSVLCVLSLLIGLFTACNQTTLSNHGGKVNESKQNVEAKEVHSDKNIESENKQLELDIDDINGLESVYELTFEEIMTPEIPFEEFVVFDKENIEEIFLEEVIDNYTFLVYRKKDQPEDIAHDEYVGVIIAGENSILYEIGRIGYGIGRHSIDKVNVFNKELIRLSGPCGANCHQNYYLDIINKQEPSVLLYLPHLGLNEIDIDSNGKKEIVIQGRQTVEIYIEENGRILYTNIEDVLGDFHYDYDSKRNEIKCYLEFDHNKILAIYKYTDKKLHFDRLYSQNPSILAEAYLVEQGYTILSHEHSADPYVLTKQLLVEFPYMQVWQKQMVDPADYLGREISGESFIIQNHPLDKWKSGSMQALGKTHVYVMIAGGEVIGGTAVQVFNESLYGAPWSLDGKIRLLIKGFLFS